MPATYEPIATTTLTSTASNITFTSIPGTYTDLRLIIMSSGTYTSVSYTNNYLQFNSDTGTNYSYTALRSSPSGPSTGRDTNLNAAEIGYTIVATANSNLFNMSIVDIFSYAGSTNKTFLSFTSADTNDAYSTQSAIAHLWRSTSAITSIKIYPGDGPYRVNTTATLYGIKAA
jgi:hypothetical protein